MSTVRLELVLVPLLLACLQDNPVLVGFSVLNALKEYRHMIDRAVA